MIDCSQFLHEDVLQMCRVTYNVRTVLCDWYSKDERECECEEDDEGDVLESPAATLGAGRRTCSRRTLELIPDSPVVPLDLPDPDTSPDTPLL